MVLVTATVVTKTVSQNCQKLSMISSLQRHLHQGGFHFYWNMDTGRCEVINIEPLKEVFKEPNGLWHPAKNISTAMQKTRGVLGPNSGAGNIRSFTKYGLQRNYMTLIPFHTQSMNIFTQNEIFLQSTFL